ncbi:MAG: hypothetical protein SPK50_07745 [Mobiluncus porci]|uniref:hypothetical protein n=1 Tax=Mobiluncus TaxID=2050 RepID=UPI0012B264EB|nr:MULTISPECIES: hypothetical protein [Mobiluncus]MCI6585004.1 hypothetical protein [Mobiluncus sp.]MDD7542144.1 hypothetical protein [Mobiluncus porci]MDY5749003.1 hypothetical protein [Mobiluncus porci]
MIITSLYFSPEILGFLYVRLLGLFISTNQEEDNSLLKFSPVNPITRSVMYSEFKNPITNGSNVADNLIVRLPSTDYGINPTKTNEVAQG